MSLGSRKQFDRATLFSWVGASLLFYWKAVCQPSHLVLVRDGKKFSGGFRRLVFHSELAVVGVVVGEEPWLRSRGLGDAPGADPEIGFSNQHLAMVTWQTIHSMAKCGVESGLL